MLALFLLILWSSCHSLETGSLLCGGDVLNPSQESCCAGVRFAFRSQSQYCCNDKIQSTLCVAAPVLYSLPSGPSLIIRSNIVNAVDGTMDTDSDNDDNDNDDADNDDNDNDDNDTDNDTDNDDVDNDTDDDESQELDDTNDESTDTSDDSDTNENDDDGEEDTETDDDNDNSSEDDDDIDTGDDNDDSSEDDDIENDDTDDTDTSTDEGEDLSGDGGFNALFGENNDNNSGYNANASHDMDYYVKITLINMWLILGLILVVNIIFYWCYCRKNNMNKRMHRVKSNNIFVDDPEVAPRSDLDEDAEII